MKKIYTIILLAFISMSANVNAQIVSIPDAHFYKALLANSVHDSAGYITADTAKAFTGTLNISSDTIADLTGIQAFINITELQCGVNNLKSLDLSSNTALVYLDCSNNDSLTSLNISSNIALSILYCYTDGLTSLNVSSNAALSMLDCSVNKIASLNVSSNTGLAALEASVNNLTSLDVSSNTSLTILGCSYNSLTSLNVKNGNNHNMIGSDFDATDNSQLTCIQVDNVAYSSTNWTQIGLTTHFSTDCNYAAVNEIAPIADISIYPNPATNELIIKSAELKMTNSTAYIIDMLGQTVFCFPLLGRGAGGEAPQSAIDVSSLPSGLYFIRVTDNEKSWVGKFVKE